MNGFDTKGVFGPAVTLLFQPPLNEEELKATTKCLKVNYCSMSLSHTKLTHRKEFCSYLLERIANYKPTTPEKIIRTDFFGKMLCQRSCSLHDRVVNILVPAMLNQAKTFVPAAGAVHEGQTLINQWLASFLESYLTDEQLIDHCDFEELVATNQDLVAGRVAIGYDLYKSVQNGEFSHGDLNSLVKGIDDTKDFLAEADHPDSVTDFTNRYRALFDQAGIHSKRFSSMVRNSLDTTFRQKCFPYMPETF